MSDDFDPNEVAPGEQVATSETPRRWRIGVLLRGALGGPQAKYWRVVLLEQDSEECPGECFLLEVDPHRTPHSTTLPQGYRLAYLRSRLSEVPDCVRLPCMGLSEEDLEGHVKQERNDRFERIEDLVKPGALIQLMRRDSRAGLLAKQMDKTGASDGVLRRLLTRYWWYGCDKNALMDRVSLRGGAGRQRLDSGTAKRGAPNAIAKHDPASPLRGVNFDRHHRDKFIEALLLYRIGKGMSLAGTYGEMCTELYRTTVVRKDGTVFFRRTPLNKIPTLSIFYQQSRRLIAELGLTNAHLGPLDLAMAEAKSGGNAGDIASGPGDIFDIDSTEFNFELVASFDPDLRLGKPTVYMVVDRSSSCIVGLHVESRPERWEGYRRALYCAFTPKTDLLERSGLLAEYGPIWNVRWIPNAVYADRGPPRGKDAFYALCKELKLEKATSGPHRPDMNAIVESLHKKIQKMLSRLPGGYQRERGQRPRKAHADARRNAMIDEEEFLGLLIAAVHDHNIELKDSNALLPKMGRSVKNTSQDIFRWGIKNSPVEHHRHLNEAELYAKLLPAIKDKAVTIKGVRLNNYYYNSGELQAWRKRQSVKRPKIDFHVDADPKYVYWRPTPRVWAELIMRPGDQAKCENMRWTDVERFIERNLQSRLRHAPKVHKAKIFPRVAEDALRKAATNEVQKVSRSGLTKQSVRAAKTIVAAKQQSGYAKAGRATMKGLTGGPKVDVQAPVDQAAAAQARPAKKRSSEPSLSELRKRAFGG